MGTVIGIDIGNSGCRISCINGDGIPIPLPLDGDKKNLRHVVTEALTADGRNCVIGEDALADIAYDCTRTIVKPKKYLADKCVSLCRVAEVDRAEAIFREILSEAIRRAEEQLSGERIIGAEIACPTYYGSSLRAALMAAGRSVVLSDGTMLNVYCLSDEVTASVLSYLNVNPPAEDKRLLAVDLGLSLKASVMDIVSAGPCVRIDPVASAGLTSYGGDIFNEILSDYVSRTYYLSTGKFLDGLWEDEYERGQLEKRIEAAKRRLSRLDVVRIPVRYNGESCNVEIRRSDFERDSERICNEMATALDKELADSGVDLSQLDGILLMGGASEMPMIKAVLGEYFGIPVTTFLHECAVADGAAIAARAYATEDPDLSIGRISPYSVGLKAYFDGRELIANVALKNTRLPISEVRTFATVSDNMPLLTLSIYENSSVKSTVSPNECDSEERLVNVNLERGLPAGSAIEMTFGVDENGLLDITVKDCVTSIEKKVMY